MHIRTSMNGWMMVLTLFLLYAACANGDGSVQESGGDEGSESPSMASLESPTTAATQYLSGLMEGNDKAASQAWRDLHYPNSPFDPSVHPTVLDFRVLSGHEIAKKHLPTGVDPSESGFHYWSPGNYRVFAAVRVDPVDAPAPWVQYILWVQRFDSSWRVVEQTYVGDDAHPQVDP